MEKELTFIYDKEWEEQEKELKQILHEIDDPEVHKNVFILESMMRAAASCYVKHKPEAKELLGKEIEKPQYYQRVLNIPIGSEIQPIPVPSTDTKLQPLHEFKEIPRFVQKTVIETPKEKKFDRVKVKFGEKQKKDLIKDKITQRVLASREIWDDYILIEPQLDDIDVEVLNKVKKKKIKNMERGWKFIQKYGKKYKIKSGHDTLIKYYVVNDVFGLGIVEPFLHDTDINEIICEGPNKSLIVCVKEEKYNTNIRIKMDDLENFIYGISKKINKKINKKIPTVEGTLRGFYFKVSLGENLDNPSFIIKL